MTSPTSQVHRQAYKGVIFDFEGTLVDFQWQLEKAEAELRTAFATLGCSGSEFSRGNYATMWNKAADRFAPEGRIDELRQALCPIYDKWDADALDRWLPRPGAANLLDQLKRGHLSVGLVSNIGRTALNEALSRFSLAEYLSPIVSRDDVITMKPRAEGILQVLTQWRLAPDEVLFVGDSLADVAGSRAAGISVAIIRGGECDESVFAANPPDHMVSQLDELPGLLSGTMDSGE